jgi:hypothetical protein
VLNSTETFFFSARPVGRHGRRAVVSAPAALTVRRVSVRLVRGFNLNRTGQPFFRLPMEIPRNARRSNPPESARERLIASWSGRRRVSHALRPCTEQDGRVPERKESAEPGPRCRAVRHGPAGSEPPTLRGGGRGATLPLPWEGGRLRAATSRGTTATGRQQRGEIWPNPGRGPGGFRPFQQSSVRSPLARATGPGTLSRGLIIACPCLVCRDGREMLKCRRDEPPPRGLNAACGGECARRSAALPRFGECGGLGRSVPSRHPRASARASRRVQELVVAWPRAPAVRAHR